jgi:DNA polymerase-4
MGEGVAAQIDFGKRKIIHVDMDCFYAAVEMRDRPELRDKAIAVGGHAEGRGVIATSNYEARKFGVRSAMATARALRLCPHLIIVRPDFSKYKKESLKIRDICLRYTALLEPLSLDEAYLDVTDTRDFDGSATRIAEKIRACIFEETGLTASAGVAPNKFLAKIASDLNKPNGTKVIRPQEIEAFMLKLPIEKIWGVGKVTAAKMHALGIHTCADLQKFSVVELTLRFGSWGPELYGYARGIDRRRVKTGRRRKSLSVEETYPEDIATLKECLAKIPELYDDWNERMVRSGLSEQIRSISVKLKFHDFQSATHESAQTSYPTIAEFRALLIEAFERRSEPVRLIGIGVRLEGEEEEVEDQENQSQLQLKLKLED